MAITTDKAQEKSQETSILLKWKQHEEMLAGIFLVAWFIHCVWWMNSLDEQTVQTTFMEAYRQHGLVFRYHRNVLFPQLGIGLVLCLTYLAVNRVIIPTFRAVDLKGSTVSIFRQLLKGIGWILLISWLLAICFNFISWFAHPWLFNYGYFQGLSLLGYNERPLTDLLFGTFTAGILVLNGSVCFGLREWLVHYLDRPGPGRTYRVLITNQCTLFAVLYFAVLTLVAACGGWDIAMLFFYLFFLPPTFLVFMVNTYKVFPANRSGRFWQQRMPGYTFLYALLCTFPFFLAAGFGATTQATTGFFICLAIQLLITTPLSWLLFRERKDRILQLRNVQKDLVQTKADLQLLRSQINPHFLFNALNTLYGTALREQAPNAAAGIQKLGDMMRFMLHDNLLDAIPLEREVDYLRNYIELQMLRIQDQPDMYIDHALPDHPCMGLIAPMLLIPFVENAFKHGISLRRSSWINIRLACGNGPLRFEVRNSIHPQPHNDPERTQSGIGLQNVRERLALLYPGRHVLDIADNGFEFSIALTIHQ